MTSYAFSETDLADYAFCQGGIHYKRGSHNKRPLVIYAALSGMILEFTRQPIRSFIPVKPEPDLVRLMCEAGRAGLSGLELGTMSRDEQRESVSQAVEIFGTPKNEQKNCYMQIGQRPQRLPTPDRGSCRRIWYTERPDDCQSFMARIDRQIMARPLLRPPVLAR